MYSWGFVTDRGDTCVLAVDSVSCLVWIWWFVHGEIVAASDCGLRCSVLSSCSEFEHWFRFIVWDKLILVMLSATRLGKSVSFFVPQCSRIHWTKTVFFLPAKEWTAFAECLFQEVLWGTAYLLWQTCCRFGRQCDYKSELVWQILEELCTQFNSR